MSMNATGSSGIGVNTRTFHIQVLVLCAMILPLNSSARAGTSEPGQSGSVVQQHAAPLESNAPTPLATDLNGFRLCQLKEVATSFLGKPFTTKKVEEETYEVHRVTDSSYMVFGYLDRTPNSMVSIQITGYPTKMLPFLGLTLGDPEESVRRQLGIPTESEKTDDPPVTVHRYGTMNYTTEIDAMGRLYTIRVSVNKGMLGDLEHLTDYKDLDWATFKKAVLKKDSSTILEWLRPDIEIYKGGKTIAIRKRWADFALKPDKAFLEALFGDTGSILAGIASLEPDPGSTMRLAENVGAGHVWKFPQGQPLNEISFFPYNGKFRIYEVAFAGGSPPAQAQSSGKGPQEETRSSPATTPADDSWYNPTEGSCEKMPDGPGKTVEGFKLLYDDAKVTDIRDSNGKIVQVDVQFEAFGATRTISYFRGMARCEEALRKERDADRQKEKEKEQRDRELKDKYR